MATEDETTADRIRRVLSEIDRPARWIARRSGIPDATFYRKMREERDFTVPEIARVARAAGVHPSELLPAQFTQGAERHTARQAAA